MIDNKELRETLFKQIPDNTWYYIVNCDNIPQASIHRDAVDIVMQRIAEKKAQWEREAIYNYRSTILAEQYDTELKTYDYNGIAEMVLEETSDE